MEDPRRDAARSLAQVLLARAYVEPVVVALSRGGVPIGAVMAHALGGALDLWLARDVPVPFHRERVLGGIAEGGTVLLDERERAALDPIMVREVVRREQGLLRHDVVRFRAGLPAPEVRGCTAIVVDEAIEAPWRVLAAVRELVARGARKVVVATPILTPAAAGALQHDTSDIACIAMAQGGDQVRAWRDALPLVTDHDLQLATAYASISLTAG